MPGSLTVERNSSRQQVEMIFQIHKASQRQDAILVLDRVSNGMGVGMRTWKRRKVGFSPLVVSLRANPLDDIRESDTSLEIVG